MAETLRSLIANPPNGEKARRDLYDAARELFMSLETPLDAMFRIFWSMELIPMAQIGVELGLFRNLSGAPEKNWSIEELASSLGADPVLLYRLARYLCSFGLISEQADRTYTSNHLTCWLASSGGEGGLKHFFLNITPVLHQLPAVLQQQGYKNPVDPMNTAWQVAHDTQLHCYSWRPKDYSRITAFMNFMEAQRESQRSWMETFPMHTLEISEEAGRNGRVLFVDVGGAGGHQCLALRRMHPELQGKIILQDQERVIAEVKTAELAEQGVEAMCHDFFDEQPVRNAKAYYMRNIMHDWPDSKCVEILARLRDVLADDSVILIDEMVLPDVRANWRQVQKDVQMMACAAAMERSVTQWNDLLAQAGLRVHEINTYDDSLGDSIVVAVRA